MSAVRSINISMELWGCIFIVLIAIYFSKDRRPKTEKGRVFLSLAICQAIILLSDALGFIFEGNPSFLHYNIVRVCNFIVFEFSYVILVLFTYYLTAYFMEKGKTSKIPFYINFTITIVATILLCISQINQMYYYVNSDSYYVRGSLFWLSQLLGIFGMIVNGVFLVIYRKRIDVHDRIPLWLYILLPVVAMLIQIRTYGIAALNLVNTISILIVFLFIQLSHARQRQAMAHKLILQDAELAETRLDLMRSQIQPHFIFNTLGTIESLCLVDPKKSAEIIHEFAHYLRGNFDELESKTPIHLSREIAHVKHYTAIENVRFPDMGIYYDLKSSDFLLPALTIQPLVENAIKHGLMGLTRGGNVVVSTYETENAYYVSVKDDGVGFDTKAPLSKEGRKHLGIANIRERLRVMCNGTLQIESSPNGGTTAIIMIPKGETL